MKINKDTANAYTCYEKYDKQHYAYYTRITHIFIFIFISTIVNHVIWT